MKAITVGSATLDIIATIANDDIEQMTLTNQTTSFLLMEPGRKVDAQGVTTHTGGGAVNAAVSLSRQGLDVSALVKVGKDLNAMKLKERFEEENISMALICEDADQATAVSLLIASHDRNAAIFTHRGANGFLTDDDVPVEAFSGANLVYVTNLSNDSANRFPAIVAHAKTNGAFVCANPGIRQLTSKTEPFFESLPNIDLFICNFHEARSLVPKLVDRTGWERGATCKPGLYEPCLSIEGFELTLQDYAARMHSLGPGFVGITDGGNGAYLSHKGKLHFQPVVEVEVQGTTGAGDAFASTLAGSLVMGETPERALALAAHNAASVVSFVDAQTGLLDRTTLAKRAGDV